MSDFECLVGGSGVAVASVSFIVHVGLAYSERVADDERHESDYAVGFAFYVESDCAVGVVNDFHFYRNRHCAALALVFACYPCVVEHAVENLPVADGFGIFCCRGECYGDRFGYIFVSVLYGFSDHLYRICGLFAEICQGERTRGCGFAVDGDAHFCVGYGGRQAYRPCDVCAVVVYIGGRCSNGRLIGHDRTVVRCSEIEVFDSG